MAKKDVLVTGMSGNIGGSVLKLLGHKYDFTALNRRVIEGVRCVSADITDLESIKPYFRGYETVIHLAAALSSGGDDTDIINRNVVGTYNVFEAARQAGVKRIIFASSGSVIRGYTNESPWRELESGEYERLPSSWPLLNNETPLRPDSIYGCSKVWGEALGRYYSDAYQMSVICIRFGWIPDTDRPAAARTYSVWCSHRDAVRMVDLCIEANETVKFEIFYAVSDNKYGYRDLIHAKNLLGYLPQDRAEDYRK